MDPHSLFLGILKAHHYGQGMLWMLLLLVEMMMHRRLGRILMGHCR